MDLHLLDIRPLTVPRDKVETETMARLLKHSAGEPGITSGARTGDGQNELVMRDRFGHPIGVLGYTGALITDFAVRSDRRLLGVGRALVMHAYERCGCTAIRGPFTEDGMAFARKMVQR